MILLIRNVTSLLVFTASFFIVFYFLEKIIPLTRSNEIVSLVMGALISILYFSKAAMIPFGRQLILFFVLLIVNAGLLWWIFGNIDYIRQI